MKGCIRGGSNKLWKSSPPSLPPPSPTHTTHTQHTHTTHTTDTNKTHTQTTHTNTQTHTNTHNTHNTHTTHLVQPALHMWENLPGQPLFFVPSRDPSIWPSLLLSYRQGARRCALPVVSSSGFSLFFFLRCASTLLDSFLTNRRSSSHQKKISSQRTATDAWKATIDWFTTTSEVRAPSERPSRCVFPAASATDQMRFLMSLPCFFAAS